MNRILPLLAGLLPRVMEFARNPISPKNLVSRLDLPESVRRSGTDPDAGPKLIYGSVSSADVANRIKTILAHHPEGSRIVISADDVRFDVKEGDEGIGLDVDRVKRLGELELTIRVKDTTVRRTVRIVPQKTEERST